MNNLAPRSHLARKTRMFPSLVIDQIARLEADYGGRAGLIAALILVPSTPDLEYFLGQLGDPKNAQESLAEICARSNMLPGQILQLIMEGGKLVARARAAHLAQAGIGPVIVDILRRAAPYEQDCTTCMVDGQPTGTVTPEPTKDKPNPTPEPCPECRGALKLLYQPELARQELALELSQLLPKGGGGIHIAMQQNAGGSGGASHTRLLDTVAQIAEDALYSEPLPPPVEAEILPPDPE